MKWSVGVTTAPRRESTLNRCAQSLQTAGWNPTVFAEPESAIPDDLTCPVVMRRDRLGVWHNWLTMVRELLDQSPDADYVLTVQDDTVLHPQAKQVVEELGWPHPATGLLMLYTPHHYSHYCQVVDAKGVLRLETWDWKRARKAARDHSTSVRMAEHPPGCRIVEEPTLWGACALVFPREVLAQVADHPVASTWQGVARRRRRSAVEPYQVKNSDVAIGKIIRALQLDIRAFVPSLAQHIGRHSTISRRRRNTGRRKAESFDVSNDLLAVFRKTCGKTRDERMERQPLVVHEPFEPATLTPPADFLNAVIEARNFHSYLEIGCDRNRTFRAVIAGRKVGVDPRRGGTVRMTSDGFFSANLEKFDLIFIDGFHHAEQVEKDIRNSLQCLATKGMVVVHDCLPRRERHQLRGAQHGDWTGDVWKAMVRIRQDAKLDSVVVDADWGFGVILPRTNSSRLICNGPLNWERYVRQRDALLRVITVERLDGFLNGDALSLSESEVTLDWPSDEVRPTNVPRHPDSDCGHLIVTRFNIDQTDPEWLDHRCRMFERFTLPSVRAQSQEDFRWLLLCDHRTPDEWRDRIRSYCDHRIFVVEQNWEHTTIPEAIRQFVELSNWQKPRIITTRLDNDDAVARSYVAQIREAAENTSGRFFINCSRGLVWHDGQIAPMTHRSSPFISCVEDTADLKSVYCRGHNQLKRVAPIHQVSQNEPQWMCVCHDWNKLNKAPSGAEWLPEESVTDTFALNPAITLPQLASQ